MNRYMEDDLPKGSFYGLVPDKILVDAFKPKFGDKKDFAVFSFFVKRRDAANKLMSYIVQKNFDLVDVGVSPDPKPDPKKDWKYILFIEMNRNKDMFTTMDKLLLHIDHLVSIKQWYFKASTDKKYMDWDRDNFVKVIPQTPDESSNIEPISGGHDEIDNVPQNSKDTDINHSLLEEVIERQVAKFNQSYIKSLKEQIKTINENKLQMSRYIEDLKIDREHLYKQLELSHDREKMALIREQQDFKRIESLENQFALLPAPGSREIKIINPDENAYDTNVKPVISVVATEAEVKDEEEIYAEIQDEYKEASEEDQHPDEAPALNESSDLDVVFDLHDEINFGESFGSVKKEHRDYPDVDDSVEKPAEQPDQEAFINAEREKPEREKPEKEKIDKADDEKANLVAELFAPAENEEVREPETTVELQDLKHIESVDSAAAARLDDIIAPSLLKESTAKVDDDSSLADDPVPKYMALGKEALKKEDYDNAIEYFLKVVDILPTAGTVVLNLADLYFLKKEYKAARKYATQALELGEESATVVLEKINAVLTPEAGVPSIEKSREDIAEDVIALEEGYKKGSEEIAPESDDYVKPHTKAAEKEPEQEIEKELQDTICIELDALNEAVDSTENTKPGTIEDAVSKDDDDEKIDQKKDDARKYTSLGVEAARQKDYRQAVEHFSKAVEILPDNAAGFCNLAILNYRLKEYETAYRYAQKAIDLGSPSAIRILEKIKQVMVADLKSTEGFEPAAEIEKIKSSQVAKKDEDESFFIESDAVTLDEFLKTEKQNESEFAVDASLREKDAVVNDSFRLGMAAFEKKELHEAIGHFNKVVELLPNGIPSYIHLTKIHYYLGEYLQARKYAKKAFELGDYTLKPILEKLDAKLAKESASLPSTGSMELKEQETPAEDIEGTEEEPEVLKSHADAEPDKKAVEDEPEPKIMVEMPDVEFIEPVALTEAADSRENTTPASIEKAVSKGDDEKIKSKIVIVSKEQPAKKKEKPQAEEAPVVTDEAKPNQTTGNQLGLQYEEPKETIAADKTVLKQAQDLVEPAGTKQPAAGNALASGTLPPATPLQKESMQVPSKSDSVNEYFKLGLAASESNDFTVALEYFNKVAKALPKVPYSFLNMADLHYRMKNYKTARKHAERALELGSHAAHRILSKIEDSLEVKSS